jgi:ATP-dependent metalloprotease
MAFQVSIPRPNVAAVASDLWPSMSNVLAAPFKRAAAQAPTAAIRNARLQQFSEQTAGTSQRVSLPECLDTVSLEALRAGLVHRPTPRRLSPLLIGSE